MSVYDTDMNLKNTEHCYYLMGLANLGLKNIEKAKAWFDKALALDNTHQLSKIYMIYNI